MPPRFARPCLTPGCAHLAAPGGRGRCATCAATREAAQRRESPRQLGSVYARHASWLRRHQPLCAHCPPDAARVWDEVDHIVPLALGGPDTLANKQGLCRAHHRAKTAREATARAQGRRVVHG